MLWVSEKIKNSNLSNARVVKLDSAEKADLIILVQVLLHEKEVEPILKELYRLLNPAGQLMIVDFDLLETNKENLLVHPGFNQEKLSDSLKKSKVKISIKERKTLWILMLKCLS